MDPIVRYVLIWHTNGDKHSEVCRIQSRAGHRAAELSRTADDRRVDVLRQEWAEDGRYWRDVKRYSVIDGDVRRVREVKAT